MDDGHIWGELLIIILLVLANGACSLAEIAIVGARKTKLQEMIDAGSKNAVYALRLAEKKEELFSISFLFAVFIDCFKYSSLSNRKKLYLFHQLKLCIFWNRPKKFLLI